MRCRVSGDQSEKSHTGIKGAKDLGEPVVGCHRSVVSAPGRRPGLEPQAKFSLAPVKEDR